MTRRSSYRRLQARTKGKKAWMPKPRKSSTQPVEKIIPYDKAEPKA